MLANKERKKYTNLSKYFRECYDQENPGQQVWLID